jgi:hypothetical protein
MIKLKVLGAAVAVTAPGFAHLQVPLRYRVDSEASTASYHPDKGQLTVVMPILKLQQRVDESVQLPQATSVQSSNRATAVSPDSCSATDALDDGIVIGGGGDTTSGGHGANDSGAIVSCRERGAQDAAMHKPEAPQKTRNQILWEQLHCAHNPTAKTLSTSQDEAQMPASVVPEEPTQPPAPVLRVDPRILGCMLDELD